MELTTTITGNIELTTTDNSSITLSTEDVTVALDVSSIPDFTIGVGLQGPEGAQGAQGNTGDKGDPLTFDTLTEEQKQALRGDVGTTSTNYVNILYQAMI